MPMEGKGVHAKWDADDSSLRVYTSTQASTSVRAAIAAKLELSLDKVEVIAPDVGGGFGVKIVHPWPEELLVPMAAIALQAEVKWAEDRREHFISSAHERQQRQEITVGYDDDGRITALDVHIWHDNGAYTPYGIIVPIVTATQLVGPYVIPVYRVIVESRLHEHRHRDAVPRRRAAAGLLRDGTDDGPHRRRAGPRPVRRPRAEPDPARPVPLRPPPDVPGRPAGHLRLGRLPGADGQAADAGRLVGGRRRSGTRPRRAASCSASAWPCTSRAPGPGPYEGGHVQVLGSGKVLVSTGLTSQGQGHETAFAQIVASELGVPIEDIEVTTGDTRRFGYAVGTFASRAAVMSGNAIALAARGVKEKALRIAADVLEADVGRPRDRGGRRPGQGDAGCVDPAADGRRPLQPAAVRVRRGGEAGDAVRRGRARTTSRRWPSAMRPGLEHRDYYSPIRSTFASGAHAAIVEIDPATWEIDVVKYAVVHDCGNVVNPMIVEGQVHGGVAQGVGGALYERMAYDKDGQLQNASFMDFLMPYASEVPDIDIDHQETPSPLNPLGIKGAGEAGVIPGTAAIASAIEDAVGRRIAAMPISPTELYDLVRDPTTRN